MIRNSFFITFGLSISFIFLAFFNYSKLITLEPKFIFCFSLSAFLFTFTSVLDDIFEDAKDSLKSIMDWKVQPILFSFSVFSLIGLPFLLKNSDFQRNIDSFTLLSMGLIFLSIMVKESRIITDQSKKIAKILDKLENQIDLIEKFDEKTQEGNNN